MRGSNPRKLRYVVPSGKIFSLDNFACESEDGKQDLLSAAKVEDWGNWTCCHRRGVAESRSLGSIGCVVQNIEFRGESGIQRAWT